MGTVVEKLSYLADTKDLFKDRLNSLGAEIIESTTFRNYLNWLDNFYIGSANKTDLAKNGVVGRTNQDGEPTPENPVEINNLSGDVEYKVRGKNLFDKGNYIELNGTPNASGTFTGGGANYNIVIPCQPNTAYTIQKRNDGNTNRFAFFCSETIPSDADNVQTKILNGTRNDTASEITITTASTAKYLIAHYYRNVETALTKQQLLDSIQIEESSTATSYEPYISESFPLSLKSKNLFDKNNTNILNAYIGGGTGTITNSNGDKCLYISIKPNTTYTISKVLSNRFRIGCTDALPNSGTTCAPFSGNKDTLTSYTITSNNSSKYLIIYYYVETDILTEQQILDSIQIEKVDNLFDKDSGFRLGYINTSGNFVNSSFTACFINQYIPCQPNTTYTISFAKIISNLGCPIYYDKNKNFLSRENTQYNTTSRTITTPSNCYYMIIQFNYNDIQMTQEIIDSVNCQVEEGSTPTDYEPYYDINLCNISDYKDRIYSQNGEFYLEKKTGKVVFDGSENWTINTSYTYNVFYRTLDNYARISNAQTTYCEYYKGIENAGGIAAFGNNYNNSIGVRTANDNIKDIYISNNSITSASDFKTWLSTHNTEVQYVLATPTTTEITQENYPTLYSQLLAIQVFLTQYKINKEFLLDYSSPEIEY